MAQIVFSCLGVTPNGEASNPLTMTDVRFEPGTLTVQPGDFEKLTVLVQPDPTTNPGSYQLIIGVPERDYRMMLTIEVG